MQRAAQARSCKAPRKREGLIFAAVQDKKDRPAVLIAGLVLAGGRSRRMGSDKAVLPLGGRPMVARAVDRMRPQVGMLAVSSNSDALGPLGPDVPVLDDAEFSFEGPLAGILAGMRWARRATPPAEWIATVAVDTPFLPTDVVHRLLAASELPTVARLAASRGRVHPVFGLWPVRLDQHLAAWLAGGGSRKVLDWVAGIPHVLVEFPDRDGHDPFFNVNTPHDAEIARSLLPESGS